MEDIGERGFYEIGGYRHNVRRYKEGINELNHIQDMLKERIELENVYSKCLRAFQERWTVHLEKHPNNSIKAIWQDVLLEAAELCRLHSHVKDRISDEIVKTITIYLKDNYHPSAFRSAKELRDIEDQFEKAQRPWKKQYEKAEKARKAFHTAAQKERSALIQKNNAEGDSSISADNARKYDLRWQKCKEEAEVAEKIYRKTVGDLDALKDDYIVRMRDVFKSCQQKELKRLKFVFEMLSGFQKVVSDMAAPTKLHQVHQRVEEGFVKVDEMFITDLNQWSEKFGPDYAHSWPKFEPFTPSLHSIGSVKGFGADSEVILVGKTDKNEYGGACGSSASGDSHNRHRSLVGDNSATSLNGGFSDVQSAGFEEPGPSIIQTNGICEASQVNDAEEQLSPKTVYEDNFDEFLSVPLYKGRVLYDYKSQDEDEISIYRGEVIEVLREPDSLNWSIGRKNGKSGLFPASYIQKTQ